MSARKYVFLPAALLAATVGAACGGGTGTPAAPPAPATSPVDPATAGTIAGRITFEGTPPPRAALRMDSDPNCLPDGSGKTTETVVVGGDGGLQHVFVYVKDGLGNLAFPVPAEPVVLDQAGCVYVPHVVGIQAGQPMTILSSDATLHNVHAMAEVNQEFNRGFPIKGIPHTHTFSTREVMVPFKCDVHGWMRAYVGVLDHPFYAVTDAGGAFSLAGLPPGTYTIEAWHESLGVQTQSVTIGETESKDITFVFTAERAAA
jgi:plastocyanin